MRLKSKELQQRLEEDGAIRIQSFIDESGINRILELYKELGVTKFGEIYSNIKDRGAEYNKKVDEVFQDIYKDSIAKYFENYQLGGGAFLIKGTGNKSHASLHQDWNVVDESKFQSAAIFCPTVDVDETNGCLQILKGSHKWFKNIRAFHHPSSYLTFDQVKKGLISLPARAGDAIVFRHNVFHGSKPNFTSETRVAASLSISTKGAQYLHYIRENEMFNVVEADQRFFHNCVREMFLGNKVELKSIGQIPFDPDWIKDFDTVFSRYQKEYPTSFFDKLNGFFKSS